MRAYPAKRLESGLRRLVPAAGMLIFVALWWAASTQYPAFILPSPLAVLQALIERTLDGTLPRNALVTLSEAVPGLLAGTAMAALLGYPVAKSGLADSLLSPFIVASQGVPIIAVAPLLFIWFGNGVAAKIIVCALIVFFPIVINIISGLRSIPSLWQDLFSVYQATPAKRFLKLELPATLPYLFTGLRVGATLSMIGAITGEFLGTDRGLGFLVNQASQNYDTALVIAVIITIASIALALYSAVRWVETRWLSRPMSRKK